MNKTLRLLAAVVGLVAALWSGPGVLAAPQRTEILWDTWGVPHIYGKNAEKLFHAFGWAQMQSHADLLLRLYGQARGRGAEYWGEEYLAVDRRVWTMGIPARARRWYDAQQPAFRKNLDAFAAGINDYARRHGDRVADEVEVMLPVSGVDVLGHVQRVIHFQFVAPQRVINSLTEGQHESGSNAWAVGPSRSASGNAMLVANPHLPWRDFFRFYEAHVVAPGIDAYGTTLVGFPVLGIAFNEHLGWSHTTNTLDGMDLYELTLTGRGYRWEGKERAFETEQRLLKIKTPDGGVKTEKLTVDRSVHGPVIARAEGKATALRVAGIDQPGMLHQWWDMARATNFAEFERAIRRLQVPIFTIMYADRAGHILHLFGGRTPVRPAGDYNWRGVVPGDGPATLWTRTHSYDEVPRVLDPPSGWLHNTNDPPWTTTFPPALDPNDFPAYMAPRRWFDFRGQSSVRLLSEGDPITFEQLVANKHSTRMGLADRLLDDLIPITNGAGPLARRAAAVLAKWDRKADVDSRGAVLFHVFLFELMDRSGGTLPDVFATPWSEAAPRTTPDGLKDSAVAVAALEAAATKVTEKHGALDVPWGDVFRLRLDEVDLPSNGGSGRWGIFRAVAYDPTDDGRYRARGGDSFVAVVEFSNPQRARVLTAPGNATQPGSPHRADQLALFSRKELRPVWRTRRQIEAHLESREVFGGE